MTQLKVDTSGNNPFPLKAGPKSIIGQTLPDTFKGTPFGGSGFSPVASSQAAAPAQVAPVTPPTTPQPMSLVDQLLANLDQNFRRTDGGYGQLINTVRDQSVGDRARIDALYKQYADMIGARQGDIAGNYDAAAQKLADVYGSAAQNTQGVYEAMRAEQQARRDRLGMTDSELSGNYGNQANANAAIEQLKALAQQDTSAGKTNALGNNIALQEAASREGAQAGTNFDRQISNLITQLAQKSNATAESNQNAYATARSNAISTAAKLQQDALIRAETLAARYPTGDINGLITEYKNSGMSDADAVRAAQAAVRYGSGTTATG